MTNFNCIKNITLNIFSYLLELNLKSGTKLSKIIYNSYNIFIKNFLDYALKK